MKLDWICYVFSIIVYIMYMVFAFPGLQKKSKILAYGLTFLMIVFVIGLPITTFTGETCIVTTLIAAIFAYAGWCCRK